jgi:hypothetical protein
MLKPNLRESGSHSLLSVLANGHPPLAAEPGFDRQPPQGSGTGMMFFRRASNHLLHCWNSKRRAKSSCYPRAATGKWFGPKAELTFHRLRYNMGKQIDADGGANRYVCSVVWRPYLASVKQRLASALHILNRFHRFHKGSAFRRRRTTCWLKTREERYLLGVHPAFWSGIGITFSGCCFENVTFLAMGTEC